jgi:hypothetical protein
MGMEEVTSICYRNDDTFLWINLGHRLKNCIISETDHDVSSLLDCSHLCLNQRPQCRSINFAKTRSRCQLNNQTKGNGKHCDLVPDKHFNYYELNPVRCTFLLIYSTRQPGDV